MKPGGTWSKGKRPWFKARLTMVGWVFAIAFFFIIAAALNTGINLLYMLAAGLLSFLVVSRLLASASLRRVEATIVAPATAQRDQEFAVTVTISNRKWLLPSGALQIVSESTGVPSGYVASLPAREFARLRVRETLPRRGEFPAPSYTLRSSFPFGLVEARRPIEGKGTILVYPRVFALRTSAAEQTSGSRYRARTVSGDGDEFFSMREYLPGDDIRRISWRASARLGKLIVRELARQNSRYVLFLLDTRKDQDREEPDFEERFEEAIELVASLGVTLLDRQYNVAVETPEAHLEGGEGTGQRRRLLEFLARANPCSMAEHPVFDEYHSKLDTHAPALLLVSPDPAAWGRRQPGRNLRALDPREVIHA